MTPYYDDGQIVIYHGDCREVLPSLAADVLVTDPPYGMSFTAGCRADGRGVGWTSRWTGVPIAGDDSTEIRDWVLAQWGTRPALVFGSWKTAMPADTREVLVWDKVVSTGMGALDIPWRPSWEAIYVLGRGFAGPRGHGVLRCSLPTLAPDRRWHPTPKPVPLLRQLLGKCPPGWIVLDPFMGVGSTLRAAADLGRQAIGIEIEERYCEIAVRRLAQQVLPLEVS
jgi:DNA modification methylase